MTSAGALRDGPPSAGRRDRDLRLERAIDRFVGMPLLLLLRALGGRGPGPEPPAPAQVRRILLVKLHGIGNLVMMLPAIKALRERFPGAELDLVTFAANVALSERIPGICRVYPLAGPSARKTVLSSPGLVATLRCRRYDLAVDFEQFAHYSAILIALSGITRSVGFRNPAHHRHLLYTTPVAYADTAHMSRLFVKLAEAAGATCTSVLPGELTFSDAEREEALRFEAQCGIAQGEALVLMHPGSSPNLTLRRWPPERFAALGDRLAADLHARIAITGGAEEESLARAVTAAMNHPAAVAAGQLSIGATIALCARAELVVSNDTALVHIASAVGTPVVAFYGPNTPFLYGPTGTDDLVFYRELPCSPCLVNVNAKLSNCRRARCIEAIEVEDVAVRIAAKYFNSDGKILPAFKKDRARWTGASGGGA